MVAIEPGAAEASRFGDLLQRHRLPAGLTEDDLADRAGLGARTIQELERGVARLNDDDSAPPLRHRRRFG